MTPAQILGTTHAAYVRLSKSIRVRSLNSNAQAYGEGFLSALQAGGYTVVAHGAIAALEKRIAELERLAAEET